MNYYVTVKEEKIREIIAQKIAAYYNGKEVNVNGGVGAQWSDWIRETITNDDGSTTARDRRVEGTHDRVSSITGTIRATANSGSVTINIDYQVQIENIG